MLERLNRKFPHRITDAVGQDMLGMHFNISLWDHSRQYHRNLLWPLRSLVDYGSKGDEYSNLLTAIQMSVWQAAEHLLLPTEDSRKRQCSHGTHAALCNMQGHDNETARIEYRCPPASANPYYAALMSLVAVYDLLDTLQYKKGRDIDKHALEAALKHTPADWNEQRVSFTEIERVFFAPGNRFRVVLNTIQSGLGDRFTEAVRHHPPGTEKTKAEAGIISRHECFEALEHEARQPPHGHGR